MKLSDKHLSVAACRRITAVQREAVAAAIAASSVRRNSFPTPRTSLEHATVMQDAAEQGRDRPHVSCANQNTDGCAIRVITPVLAISDATVGSQDPD
jgi:hypothetical protein